MNAQDPLGFLGDAFNFPDSRQEMQKNISLIIRIRWFVSPSIFLIMFTAGLFGLARKTGLTENQLIVNGVNLLVVLGMNITYTVLVRRLENLKPLVLFQLIIDVVHLP
ncbi:MAG: hypothetical protein AB1798_02395 [Spirochaetota bacterium]